MPGPQTPPGISPISSDEDAHHSGVEASAQLSTKNLPAAVSLQTPSGTGGNASKEHATEQNETLGVSKLPPLQANSGKPFCYQLPEASHSQDHPNDQPTPAGKFEKKKVTTTKYRSPSNIRGRRDNYQKMKKITNDRLPELLHESVVSLRPTAAGPPPTPECVDTPAPVDSPKDTEPADGSAEVPTSAAESEIMRNIVNEIMDEMYKSFK